MRVEDVPNEVFKSGIMDKEYHSRLIADLENVSMVAGIPPSMVWSRLSEYCGQHEIDWVKHMRDDQSAGMVYVGVYDVPVEDKMMAIAGALLRNHIDARMMIVQDVIAALKDGDMPFPKVLLIPNFCLDKKNGGDIPTWEVSQLMGLLLSRMARGKKTILYVGSMTSLEIQYGSAFRKHIEAHYTTA